MCRSFASFKDARKAGYERNVHMSYHEEGMLPTGFYCSDRRPNIFLIGDSIRMGYCTFAKEALGESAEVFWVEDNCRNTQYVISCLNGWKNMFDRPEKVDLVQFNCGHWDIAHWNRYPVPLTSEVEYEKNLEMILFLIRELFPNAKVVMATTTPMNLGDDGGVNPRSNTEIARYNKIVLQVAKKNGIPVNDLAAFTRDWGVEAFADYCHFTPESNKALGIEVAEQLKKYL